MKYYLGMDIGCTKCAVVLSESDAVCIMDKIRFDTNAERDTKARKIGMAMGAGALVGGLIRILCY